jgi:CubicO group peptidase (beta-lactamase class C family)
MERPPTIQDLLRHTAGFGGGDENDAVDVAYNRENLFGLDISLKQVIEKLSRIPLVEQPGKRFIYSLAPDVQARLVEVLTGRHFAEFLEDRLFVPLRMQDTGFWVPKNQANRLATVYWRKSGRLTALDDVHGYPAEGGALVQPWSVNSYTVNHGRKGGSYGLVGTAEDYWHFAQMILNGGELDGIRILSPQIVRYMTRDHLHAIGSEVPNGRPGSVGFGLGFAVTKDPVALGFMSSEGLVYWAGAADTHFWVDPKEDMVVVAMAQDMGGAPELDLLPQLRTLVYSAILE